MTDAELDAIMRATEQGLTVEVPIRYKARKGVNQ